MSQQTAESPPWAKGIPMEQLRDLAALFREHDRGLILGAFGAYKENAVAIAIDRGRMRVRLDGDRRPIAALDIERLERKRIFRDFAGTAVGEAKPGDLVIRRMAASSAGALFAHAESVLSRLLAPRPGAALWAEIWQEHPLERALVEWLGLHWAGTKVKASSELRGIWAPPALPALGTDLVPESDLVGIARLPVDLPELALERAEEALEDLPAAADHYSSYNKRHSWAALSLRGYAPEGEQADPAFIEKPAEMSKAWKAENEEKLSWPLADSPLRAAFPVFDELIGLLPGEKERIRLMRLAPGGGELTRHADITDPDAGTRDGRTVRIHIPIRTNPGVRFSMWDLMGNRTEAHMFRGGVFSLDTRKPHTARNDGEEDRWHLVMDVFSGPALRLLLRLSDGAPIAEPARIADLSGIRPFGTGR